MTSPSTVLALGHVQVHVCTPYGSHVIFYVKATINKFLSFASTLNVLDIKPYNGYI